ncbi:hypothetical protein JKF63_06917 [Porcisia hertigi]|uniref:Uncharacterized protein n=1 Tax=Porcisia hertigi TaxID=2761500 RepID=A0A836LJD8_9TRYP|nr:hypothetical protein JKF63_06917 [Porcisia hertigi]
MPKQLGTKSKAAAAALSSGPPPLYEEALSGPPLVVEITGLSVWSTKTGADAARKAGCLTNGARWGHAAVLSPNETVLCIIGGTPCSRSHMSEDAAVPLWEYTSATTATAPTAGSTSFYKMVTAAVLPTPHIWMAGAAQTAATQDAIHGAKTDAAKNHDWPLFAPWWASWSPVKGTDGPSVMYADGGWDGARRITGVRAFAGCVKGGDSLLLPPLSVVVANSTRSHHSVTNVQGRLYRFGGETQQGTVAALEEIEGASVLLGKKREAGDLSRSKNEKEAAAPTAALSRGGAPILEPTTVAPNPFPVLGSPPPRAAHGACSLNQRYIVVFGGRQIHTQGDDVDALAAAVSGGKGGRAKKAATARAQSPGKRGGTPGRDRKNSLAAIDTTLPRSATLTVLKDVAIYDTALSSWLPVQVMKCGAVPCARYAAAVAAVPVHAIGSQTGRHRSPVADAVQREVLVVGGLDAGGSMCADAWVMQVMSGTDAELAEVPADSASTAVPLVRVRWVRLEARCAADSPFQRHHAAAVVSSRRVVYLVGGCGSDDAAVPCVCTLELPPLTAASVKSAETIG